MPRPIARPGQRAPRGFTLPFTPERPLLFVHVPKCGGSSVEWLLRQMFPAGAVRRLEHHPDRLRENWAGLGRHACYSGHVPYRFRELLPRGAAAATFLREPVDRAVSTFYYWRSLGREYLGSVGATPEAARCCDLSLAEFVRAESLAARMELGDVQTELFSSRPVPSGRWSGPKPWRAMTRSDLDEARRSLERCEFVGLTERLDESVRLLGRMCGWPEPDAAPHVNRTPARPPVADLDPATRGLLEEWTARDAELYRFAAELFADRLRDAPRPRLPPAPGRIDLTFDGPVPGWGWYDRECGPHGHFCWTRQTAWLEFRLAGAGDLALEVDVPGAVDPAQLDGLTAAVNGRPVPLTRARVGAVDRFEGRAPAGHAADGRYRVALRVPRAVRPADVLPGSTDRRELGVAVSRIALGFAEPPGGTPADPGSARLPPARSVPYPRSDGFLPPR